LISAVLIVVCFQQRYWRKAAVTRKVDLVLVLVVTVTMTATKVSYVLPVCFSPVGSAHVFLSLIVPTKAEDRSFFLFVCAQSKSYGQIGMKFSV